MPLSQVGLGKKPLPETREPLLDNRDNKKLSWSRKMEEIFNLFTQLKQISDSFPTPASMQKGN